MNRRSLLLTGAATATFPASITSAHTTLPDYNVPEEHMPREIRIKQKLEPFEVHVIPSEFALYWTLPKRRAIRYTVGIGRPGLYEAGEFFVGAKREWPSWTPTPAMIKREPGRYQKYSDGVPGGLNNPLGARALYLFTPERGDTYLRIHGTNDPSTISRAVSNGCARLVNNQIVEFYERVPLNTRVVLYSNVA
jgi:lipoprotein-anchoring transpeptidase ErfK/SrfK